jgi:putative endonuclease
MLECADGSYYTGYTTDVAKRLSAHRDGKGAKYTKGRQPLDLIYEESFQTKSEALKREYAIKQLTKKQKKLMVESGEPFEYTRKLQK